MKILSISGENLASLGKFDVKLDEGVLRAAGLFAIVGPTGAGKSTLLDALCLALYGVTPRSNEAGTVRVPNAYGDTWTAGDERQIVRHGTTHAHAEVAFEVADGAGATQTYVARWAVTSNKEGALKAPTMVLKRGAEVVASGKRAVEAFVESAIGMDFDNFCRSVLLAQGAFAAFLKAKGAQRSHVLEVLTDPTELYRRLSRAAHKKGAASAAVLQEATAAVQAVTPLDAEARAATEAELVRLAGVIEALAARGAAVASDQTLWGAFDDAAGDLVRARAGAALAEQRWEGLAAERTVVGEHESVQPLAAPVAALREAERAVTAAAAELVTAEEALTAAKLVVERQAPVVEAARAAVQALEGAFAAGSADRAEAVRLDTVIALGESDRVARAKGVVDLEERLSVVRANGAALDARADAVEVRARAVAAWHLAHPSASILAAHADVWTHALARFLEESRAAGEAARRHTTCVRAHEDAVEAHRRAVDAHAKAEASEARARGVVEACEQEEEAARAQAPAGRTAEVAQRLEQWRTLERRRADADALRLRVVEESGKQVAAVREAEEAAAAAATHAETVRALGEELEAAKNAELLARVHASTAELRAALVDGEPCQVCGSLEHPLAAPGAIVATHDATRRRQELEAARNEASSATTAAMTRAAAAGAHAEAAQGNLAHARTQLAELEESWRGMTAALAGAEGLTLSDAAGALAERLEQTARELAAAEAAAAAVEVARGAALAARTQRDAAILATQVALAGRTKATTEMTAAETAVGREDLARQGHLARCEAAWLEAAPALVGVPDAEEGFRNRPEETRVAWTALVAGVAAQANEQVAIDRERNELATLRAAHDTSLAETTARLGPARVALAELEAALAVRRGERALLLGGRTVAEVEHAHAEAHAKLVSTFDAEADVLARAREDVVARTTDVSHRAATRDGAQTAHATRREAYVRTLAEIGLDAAECARRLAHDPVLVQAHRRAIAEAAEARAASTLQVAAAATRHAEAQAALPERSREVLEAETRAIVDARDVANREVGANRQVLDADDAQRVLRATREAELRALEAEHGVWGRLAQVIGHGEGNTFAIFAQSLSFDSLLHATNREIARVRPRYELVAVAPNEAGTGALEMAIRDAEHGDEVRPLSTLSGGETFLVSLSMALGLSSLTASSRALGTLFIDEGFGSLDAETLSVALDALRTLQARGTQVGVISHVGDLVELTPARVRVVKVSEGLSKVVTE